MTREEITRAFEKGADLYHIRIGDDDGLPEVKVVCRRLEPIKARWVFVRGNCLYGDGGHAFVLNYRDIYPNMKPIIDEAHKRGKG